MTKPTTVDCYSCVFWENILKDDLTESGHGLCHRYAPRPVTHFTANERDPTAFWPRTADHDRCGEGVEKEEE